MSFLAPLWFLLAGAAAVPLLVHLLRRRSGARTEFPAARYLLRAEREHSRSLRLRNMLLMLLRVLAVLFIAAAAARPATRLFAGAGAGHAPTALAIVLDNSLSSTVVENGRPLLEQMRESARTAIAAASPQDRVWLVTADGHVHGGTSVTAAAALEAVAPLGGAGDLRGAIQRAAATIAQVPGVARQIAVLTDGQRSAWAEPIDVSDDADVLLLRVGGGAPANRAVTRAAVRPPRWTLQGAIEIAIQATDSVSYRVRLGRDSAAMRTLGRGMAAPGEPIVVRGAPGDTGWMRGVIEIDGDEMPGDDTRHFAVWVGAAPRVGATPAAGPFVRSALDVLRGDGRIASGREVLIASAEELGASREPALVTAPATSAALGAANQALARRGIPWRFGAAQPAGVVRDGGVLAGATVRASYELVPTEVASADTIASLNGRPWIVAGMAAGSRYVLIASPLVPDATDLPVRAAFVPWVASTAADRLVGGEGSVVHAAPSATVPRPVWADSITLADGSSMALSGESVAVPATAGVYFLSRGGRRAGALVVNAEETESVLDRWSGTELQAQVRADRVEVATGQSAWLDRLFAAGGTRSMIAPVIVAVLLLLVAEAVATSTRVRGAG